VLIASYRTATSCLLSRRRC